MACRSSRPLGRSADVTTLRGQSNDPKRKPQVQRSALWGDGWQRKPGWIVGAQLQGNMNEGPDLAWLALLTVGVAALAAAMIYALAHYRNWQNRRRRSRPTD